MVAGAGHAVLLWTRAESEAGFREKSGEKATSGSGEQQRGA